VNTEKLELMLAGIEPWRENFSDGSAERRGASGMSWYDLSLKNALPCDKEIAIVVNAWFGHLKFLKPVLTKYRESGAFVILAYDNPF